MNAKTTLLALAFSAALLLPAAGQSIGGNASVSSTSPTSARVALPVDRARWPAALIVPDPTAVVGVYYKLGDSSVAATTASPVLPKGGICLNLGPNTNLAVLAFSSAAKVNVTQLSQCPLFSGGSFAAP